MSYSNQEDIDDLEVSSDKDKNKKKKSCVAAPK